MLRRIALLPFLVLAGAACHRASGPAAPQAIVRGTVTCRERAVLLPGATVVVKLADVTRRDAPAVVLAERRIAVTGKPPIAFALGYDASAVREDHRYTVSARILVDDRLVWVTDRSYPVLTRGHGGTVDLVLVSASSRGVATPIARRAQAAEGSIADRR